MKKFILFFLILPLTLMARPEKKWLQIPTAGFFGSVTWATTTNCRWVTASDHSVFQTPTDADCDDNARTIRGQYNTTNGDAGDADGRQALIKFSYMPKGRYVFKMNGFFYNTSNSQTCFMRFYNGTDGTNPGSTYSSAGSVSSNHYESELLIDSDKTNQTIYFQIRRNANSASCDIIANTGSESLQLSVYYYPDFSDSRYIITK